MNIQKASQAEINAYNVADLEIGMLVYNTDENRIFEYTDVGFLEILTAGNVYTGVFIITSSGVTTVTGIPFKPSQITFVGHPNIETLNVNAAGVTPSNLPITDNNFGTMNGFARNDNGTTVQQVIYIGGNASSINNSSRFASSANCIGIKYGDRDAIELGLLTSTLTSFTADGFTLNTSATGDAINEDLVVMFTAYK